MLIYGLRGALCSAIAYFIAMKVIDMVQAGFDESKNIMIISAIHGKLETQFKLI